MPWRARSDRRRAPGNRGKYNPIVSWRQFFLAAVSRKPRSPRVPGAHRPGSPAPGVVRSYRADIGDRPRRRGNAGGCPRRLTR
ncbi:MAG: hypothetical protein OXU61_00480 [Gammaproteobacteria bacterium]|nr:hypothetical protein [Gammaproteobacteria bacterium]